MNIFQKYGKLIEKQLHLNIYPLAIKMLKDVENIPEGAKRPKRDFGACMATCQCFSLSRWNGTMVAQLFEDMWCPEPVIGFGLAEPPQYFLEGHNRYPGGVKTLEMGANWAREFPRFEIGKYVGIVSAPLKTANFEPDLVMIYCNTDQLQKLILGLAYKASEGRDITALLGGHSACVYAVVPTIKEGKCQVSVPCGGDRRHAGAHEDEMIFSLPKEQLKDLLLGLIKTHASRARDLAKEPEYRLAPSYVKMAKLMGMKKSDGTEIE